MKNWNAEKSQAVAAWRSYRLAAFGGDELPDDQEIECSLAFYAGMVSALATLSQLSNAAETEDDGAAKIEAWRQDLIEAGTHANIYRASGRS